MKWSCFDYFFFSSHINVVQPLIQSVFHQLPFSQLQ